METCVFKRILCDGIPLDDRERRFDRVEEAHRPGDARLQRDGLGDLTDNDVGWYVDLRNFVAAGDYLEDRIDRRNLPRRPCGQLLDRRQITRFPAMLRGGGHPPRRRKTKQVNLQNNMRQ